MPMRHITVLSGGSGGARLLPGLRHALASGSVPGLSAETTVTVVGNTADDLWVHGLKVCPDLDTMMYTLGDGVDADRGWGRRRGDLERPGRAGGVRRGTLVVRARRP